MPSESHLSADEVFPQKKFCTAVFPNDNFDLTGIPICWAENVKVLVWKPLISLASEPCQNMPPLKFGGEQGDSVPASVE